MVIKIKLPEDVKFILNEIRHKNYQALVVGGAIRDSLLGIEPKDYDIATNCPYNKILDIFRDYSPKEIGKAFGIVQIKINGVEYEIAKFRTDGNYSDNRRPDSVEFVDNFYEDAKRRDFSVNAMGYDGEKLFDYFDGYNDLKEGALKFVGDPHRRIEEDALRMMRAVRFATKYNMKTMHGHHVAIFNNSYMIKKISSERIRMEIDKILLCNKPSRAFRIMHDTNLLNIILPELQKCVGFNQNSPYHDKDLFSHIMDTLDNTQPILINRLSALMHDLGKVDCYSVDESGVGHFFGHEKESSIIAEGIMKRLKYDNKTIDSVSSIVKDHMSKSQKITPKACKRFINRVGVENLDSVFDLMWADIKAHSEPHNFTSLNTLKSKCKEVLEKKEPTKKSHLEINGNDIMKLGVKEGKKVGEFLEYCMEIVLDDPEMNNKEVLIKRIKENKHRRK